MYAQEEENKTDTLLCDERMIYNGVEEREPTEKMTALCNKIFNVMTERKTDSNTFGYGLRIFKLSSTCKPGFPQITTIRKLYSKVVSALYLFKLHYPHAQGHTHGVHLRINGFAPRHLLDQLIQECVKLFSQEVVTLDAVVPHVTKDMSLFDYLQTLYVIPQNLLVNYSHKCDAIPEEMEVKLDYNVVAKLKERIQCLTTQILDNILAMPLRYQNTYMAMVMNMKPHDFSKHMRQTNLKEMSYKAGENAYNMALQDYKFKSAEVQELMDPVTRRSMLNRCICDKTTKQIQLLLQQHFGLSFVHPHPYNGIFRLDIHALKPIDGLLFDYRFLFPLLMTSRWFARTCMREEESVTNNHTHLLLYGGACTGKSLIVSAISSVIQTYKYLANSKFQNPELLQSSLFSIEEFDTSMLASNQYKALLDFKAPVKIDFKNLHPENVSEGVPCMITSNDEVLTVLRTQKKYNQQSADAAIRRLYIIPLKMGQFEKMHGKVPTEHPQRTNLLQFDPRFESEPNRLVRMFNLMFAFGLFQQDLTNMYIHKRLRGYMDKVIGDFKRTMFGTFYLSNKDRVDELIRQTEDTMMKPDLSDTEYLSNFAVAVGQFHQLIVQFILTIGSKLADFQPEIIKDSQIPQPIKYYYLQSRSNFVAKLMWEVDETKKVLNPEIERYLADPTMKLFSFTQIEITDPYEDLHEHESLFNQSDEQPNEPFPQTAQMARSMPDEFKSHIESMKLYPTSEDEFLDGMLLKKKRTRADADLILGDPDDMNDKRFKFDQD